MKYFWFILFLICFSFSSLIGDAAQRNLFSKGHAGAISTGCPYAGQAALQVLKSGGNAVDALVAAAFMLCVTDFSNFGLGGDGFGLVKTSGGRVYAFDGSIRRPSNCSDSYIGLPTAVEMLVKMHRLFGRKDLSFLIRPAVKMAEKGFRVTPWLEKVIESRIAGLNDKEAIKLLAPNGYPIRAGQVLKNEKLAKTLAKIAADSGESFYRGNCAFVMINDMNRRKAGYQLEDFSRYTSKLVEPVLFEWNNNRIYGTPPPSSSIVSIKLAMYMLKNRLELFPETASQLEKMALAGRKFIDIQYCSVAASIKEPANFIDKLNNKLGSRTGKTNQYQQECLGDTTHISIIDKDSMAVSVTLTLGSHFGTGDYSPLGFFYNNQMRNYTQLIAQYPDCYPSNAGPVSAKSPVLIINDDSNLIFAVGGAGGHRIITNLASVIARVLSCCCSIEKSVRYPRFFINYKNVWQVEWGLHKHILKRLDQKHQINIRPGCDDYFGLISLAAQKNNKFFAIGDQRRGGDSRTLK